MARAGVTYHDISKAAEAVRSQGEEPTIDRVRAWLGTGSKSTIAPLLKRWRGVTEGLTQEVNAGLPTDLVEAVKALHERVQHAAEETIEQAKQDNQARVQVLLKSLDEERKALAESAAREKALKQQVAEFKQFNDKLSSDLETLRFTLVKTETQYEAVESKVTELKATTSELKQENRDIRAHFEHYQQRTAEDRQREREQADSAQQQLRGQCQQLNEQLAKAQAEQQAARQQHDATLNQVDYLKQENQQLQQTLATSTQQTETLERQNEATQAQLKSAQQQKKELASQLTSSSEQVMVAKQEASHLRDNLKKAESGLQKAKDQIAHLEDENSLIAQEKAVLQGRFVQLQDSLN